MNTKPKILIIDDEFVIHKLFINLLCIDYNLLSANSGTQGLEMVRNEKPALVMLDYQLKDMDGDEFLSKLQPRDLLHTRLALISGHAKLEDLRKENQNKVDHFFSKPFLNLQKMVDVIESLTRKNR